MERHDRREKRTLNEGIFTKNCFAFYAHETHRTINMREGKI